MKILVTGAAGFIGYYLVKALLVNGDVVVGIDNINDYYDVDLKYARLVDCGIQKKYLRDNIKIQSTLNANYSFLKMDLVDYTNLEKLFNIEHFDVVVNLAAQAGVRYSLENPHSYVQSNLVGFVNILECCRYHKIKHFVYASSSSVYGMNAKIPFDEDDQVDRPVSLYAATKKSNELLAHAYSHLYQLPTTGIRFFTVYGPYGRPDMSPMLFAEAILSGKPIKVFNQGDMSRDFTYIDDIIDGITIVLNTIPKVEPNSSIYRVFNIGKGSPQPLSRFIEAIESSLGIKAIKEMLPMQPGDVKRTWADTSRLNDLGYLPKTDIEEGIDRFIKWFLEYKRDHKGVF